MKLKMSDREAVIKGVLVDNFNSRFDAIEEEFSKLLVSYLKKDHPTFIKLIANEDTRKYLSVAYIGRFYVKLGPETKMTAVRPVCGTNSFMIGDRQHYDGSKHRLFKDHKTVVPYSITQFLIETPKLIGEYKKAWSDYSSAYETLANTLYGYTTVAKLIADFPEFEKYLPTLKTKCLLPAVVAKNIRAELAKVGVPKK